VSVVLPCRNEETAIGQSIAKIKEIFNYYSINGEIIVSDSSSDTSPLIAEKMGATVIKHGLIGYGSAYLEGFKAAKGKYIFMADPDGSYDFVEIPNFLYYLREGRYDFIIGNRFSGKMDYRAMPPLNRYLGNPLLSFIFKIIFRAELTDIHCGMRAIGRETLQTLRLKSTGMEFASEMIIAAMKQKLRIKELPIPYHRRLGRSKLRPLADGWRHLRLMFANRPRIISSIESAKSKND
jgi:glycosyltransferase involved in cell wall biosynthesis